ncbi:hypothetical protein F5Y03DRAFT_98923 [Xylaria venustula]|nr:hypothetical protein F5Y03DRAFT_98923 [Xylaria venustula]
MTLISIAMAAIALYAGTATAIWDCKTNQHVYNPTEGKFLVHCRSVRDTKYNGQPWVRTRSFSHTPERIISQQAEDVMTHNPSRNTDSSLLARDNGRVALVGSVSDAVPCRPATIISSAKMGLKDDLSVTNGDGCDKDASGLSGASIGYGDRIIKLASSGGACSPRDHGITCQFDA